MQNPEAIVWARVILEREIWKDAVRFVMYPTEKQWRRIESVVAYTKHRTRFVEGHLGVCLQCEKVYLKPKYGADARYCCPACTQKAYRERKALKEG